MFSSEELKKQVEQSLKKLEDRSNYLAQINSDINLLEDIINGVNIIMPDESIWLWCTSDLEGISSIGYGAYSKNRRILYKCEDNGTIVIKPLTESKWKIRVELHKYLPELVRVIERESVKCVDSVIRNAKGLNVD